MVLLLQERIVIQKDAEQITSGLKLDPRYTYHYQWQSNGVAIEHYMVYKYNQFGFDIWTLSDDSPYE